MYGAGAVGGGQSNPMAGFGMGGGGEPVR